MLANEQYGITPLHQAASRNQLSVAEALITAGSDPNAKNWVNHALHPLAQLLLLSVLGRRRRLLRILPNKTTTMPCSNFSRVAVEWTYDGKPSVKAQIYTLDSTHIYKIKVKY